MNKYKVTKEEYDEWYYNYKTNNKKYMTPNDGETSFVYQTNIERYLATLPWHRRLLARFFDKYKVTKEEYDEWYYNYKKHFI